jgi:hypothetical protein
MINATKDYKMSKGAKIMLSQIADPHHRGVVRKSVVESEMHEKNARHSKMRNHNVSNDQGEE